MNDLKIGQKVKQGTIIGFDNDAKNKPVIIQLNEEKTSLRGKKYKVGYFHFNQITV